MSKDQTLYSLLPKAPSNHLVRAKRSEVSLYDVMLPFIGGTFLKDTNCKVTLIGHSREDCYALQSHFELWCRQQQEAIGTNWRRPEAIRNAVSTVHDYNTFTPDALTNFIYKGSRGAPVFILFDSSRDITEENANHWHRYAKAITTQVLCHCVHLAHTGTRGEAGPDANLYSDVWDVSDYHPRDTLERVNNAALIKRVHRGETKPPLILRDRPSYGINLWYLTAEEAEAAA
jgi:hypothetical protein